jgi:hypothetical protein
MIRFLFCIRKKHIPASESSSSEKDGSNNTKLKDLAEKINQQNWLLLDNHERMELAEFLKKIGHDEHTLKKYIHCWTDPVDMKNRLQEIIADLTNNRLYYTYVKTKEICRMGEFFQNCFEWGDELDEKTWDELKKCIESVHGRMEKTQKKIDSCTKPRPIEEQIEDAAIQYHNNNT